MSNKPNLGNFLEDFRLDPEIRHATPRTLGWGDVALYTSLYGSRFPVPSADSFSLNAVANLGYAECRWLAPVYPGDTLTAVSRVIGIKENSNRKTGVVYVRSQGYKDGDELVLDFVRWVMVKKRDETAEVAAERVPQPALAVRADQLRVPAGLDFTQYDWQLAGSRFGWEDYAIGEKIDHVDGMTIEEAEHQLATRLYQNTAKVHFDQFRQGQEKIGRRLIYGGHIISLARSLSFNGLGNGAFMAAINGGRHVNPSHAGHTIYAWSEILDKARIDGRGDVGALRVRTVALKDQPATGFPDKDAEGKYLDNVVLDLDYWVLMPRK